MARCLYCCHWQLLQAFLFNGEGRSLRSPQPVIDLYALHQVYIPRINRALLIFKNGWNCHKLRTAGKSPNELYTSSMITTMTSADDVNECYGVDEDGPVPVEVDTVDIPSIEVDLEEGVLDLLSAVDSCQPSDSFGVDIYRHVCGILGHR